MFGDIKKKDRIFSKASIF